MENTRERRGRLRRWIVDRWTPLFEAETSITPITVEEFATACDWERLCSSGSVANHEEPLGLAGLRLSSIFPRHLLRRRDDGRLIPIAFDDARALVHFTLAAEGRDIVSSSNTILGSSGADKLNGMCALDSAIIGDANLKENSGTAKTDASVAGGATTISSGTRTRRHLFRRRD